MFYFMLAETRIETAKEEISGFVKFLIDNPFGVALTLIFLVALVGAFAAARKRDRCLKKLRDYPVTVRDQAGRSIWGQLKVFSKGLELMYAQSTENTKKQSILLYEPELTSLLAIYRFLDRLERHSPDILAAVHAIVADGTLEAMRAGYPSIRATSIDYAVMEPASLEGAVAVVPMSVGWSDLGSWSALRDAWRSDADASARGAVGLGNRHDVGSTDTLVLAGGRLVVTIGLHDVIVIDTPEALLVCAAERSQDVRGVAQHFTTAAAPAAGTATEPATNQEEQP